LTPDKSAAFTANPAASGFAFFTAYQSGSATQTGVFALALASGTCTQLASTTDFDEPRSFAYAEDGAGAGYLLVGAACAGAPCVVRSPLATTAADATWTPVLDARSDISSTGEPERYAAAANIDVRAIAVSPTDATAVVVGLHASTDFDYHVPHHLFTSADGGATFTYDAAFDGLLPTKRTWHLDFDPTGTLLYVGTASASVYATNWP
jgi:hypothetical protein